MECAKHIHSKRHNCMMIMHRIKAELSHSYKVTLNPTLASETHTHRADFQITPADEGNKQRSQSRW